MADFSQEVPLENTEIDTEFYQRKKQWAVYLALLFLVFTILLTAGLYGYNYRVKSQTEQYKAQLSQVEDSITNIESDPQVKIYNIYKKHSVAMNLLSEKSEISQMVSELKKNMLRYGIKFEWFNYDAGKIETTMLAETDNQGYAYSKITRFLETYRSEAQAMFHIEPISDFEGHDDIEAGVYFVYVPEAQRQQNIPLEAEASVQTDISSEENQ